MKTKMRIQEHRQAMGITQEKFAKQLGVSLSTICKWEQWRAYPEAWRLPVISAALSCTIDDLFVKPQTRDVAS